MSELYQVKRSAHEAHTSRNIVVRLFCFLIHVGDSTQKLCICQQKKEIFVITSYSIHYTKLYEKTGSSSGARYSEDNIIDSGIDIEEPEGGADIPPVLPILSTTNIIVFPDMVARITSYNVCYTKLLRPL